MTDKKLMQQALEKLEFFSHMKSVSEDTMRLIADLRERLTQSEQEPFCYHDGRNIVGKEYADHSDVFPLYTAPRQWQGLTDEDLDIQALWDILAGMNNADGSIVVKFARAIEAKLKDKNT